MRWVRIAGVRWTKFSSESHHRTQNADGEERGRTLRIYSDDGLDWVLVLLFTRIRRKKIEMLGQGSYLTQPHSSPPNLPYLMHRDA